MPWSSITLVFVVALAAACHGEGDSPSPDGKSPTPPANSPASAPAVLRLVPAGGSSGFSSVRPLFEKHCSSCHGPEGRSPYVTSYPFSSDDPSATSASIATTVTNRLRDQENPMPPTGPLPEDTLETIENWAAGLSKQFPPSGEALDPEAFRVVAAWVSADGQGSASLLPQGNGTWETEGPVPIPSSPATITFELRTPSGRTLGTRRYERTSDAGGEIVVRWPELARTVDTTAPQTDGTVETQWNSDGSLTLSWPEAEDAETRAAALDYRVLVSSGSSVNAGSGAEPKVLGKELMGKTTLTARGFSSADSYTFQVIARDQGGHEASYAPVTVHSPAQSQPDSYDIVSYGKDCSARLGMFKPFNCLDGKLIPISLNGTSHRNGHPNGSFGRELRCDKPDLLTEQCNPFSRIGKLKSYGPEGSVKPNVETIFICRRYENLSGGRRWQGEYFDGESFPAFPDVAVIQYDRKTGESCWYQMIAEGKGRKDSRRVPPPTEVALPADAPDHALSSHEYWLTPEEIADRDCVRCHDSDVFVHSPYIDQVKDDQGNPFVPSHPQGPFRIIGKKYLTKWLTDSDRIPYSIDTADENQCTSCHRMGSRNTCNNFALQALGQKYPETMSDYAKNHFELSHWMPPSGVRGFADWYANEGGFKEDAEELMACCRNPDQLGCQKKTLIGPALPYVESSP